jgi:L-lactate dehydrogenase complex protein LldF
MANRVLALFGRADGRSRALPLASGWTRFRDFPAPQPGGTFHARWAKRKA